MNTTDFQSDIKLGRVGELIFKEDFLEFLNINYIDVTDCQRFQIIDNDFITKIGFYEVKSNYKDNKILIFEDYTNINEQLGKISYGWFYKTKADLIVFVSKTTRTMILLPFNEEFKNYYINVICENTQLEYNRITTKGSYSWQSAFRRVPFDMLTNYISVYKKLNK